MKNIKSYFLIGVVAVCILALIFINPEEVSEKLERDVKPSPQSEQSLKEELQAEQYYFIDVPAQWVEVIDDKNSIDAEITVADMIKTDGFRKATAKRSSAKEEQVLALLEEDFHPYAGTDSDDLIQYLGEHDMYLYFPREEGQDGISLSTDTYDYISMAYRDGLAEDYNRDKYVVDQEVEGFPLKECDDRLRELCACIGINGEFQIVHRALDYRTMEEEAIELHIDGTETKPDYPWSPEDNSYYCAISQLCNDIPVIPSYYISAYRDILNVSAHNCILNQDRFISFYFDRTYDIQYKEDFEELLDFSEIVDKYKQYANLRLEGFNKKITDITMRVIPIDKGSESYEMVPVWIFYGICYEESIDDASNFAVIMNAITGDRL